MTSEKQSQPDTSARRSPVVKLVARTEAALEQAVHRLDGAVARAERRFAAREQRGSGDADLPSAENTET